MITRRTYPGHNNNSLKKLDSTNTLTPTSAINQILNGRKWRVEYFNKQQQADEQIVRFDLNEASNLQDFIFIKDKILVVKDEMDVNDPNLAFTAYIQHIQPNLGDIFIGRLDGGFYGLFAPVNVERESYRNDSVYIVEFTLYKLLPTDADVEELMVALRPGTAETHVEAPSMNRLTTTILPVAIVDKLNSLRENRKFLTNLLLSIPETLPWNLLTPMMDGKHIADASLERFMDFIIPYSEYSIKHVKSLSYLRYGKIRGLYDLLMDRNRHGQINIYQKLISDSFSPTSHEEMVIKFEAYGGGMTLSKGLEFAVDADGLVYYPDGVGIPDILFGENDHLVPDVIPSLEDETYVFSPMFYGIPSLKDIVQFEIPAGELPDPTKIQPIKTTKIELDENGDEVLDADGNPVIIPLTQLELNTEIQKFISTYETLKIEFIPQLEDLTMLERAVTNFVLGQNIDIDELLECSIKLIENYDHNTLLYYGSIIIWLSHNVEEQVDYILH